MDFARKVLAANWPEWELVDKIGVGSFGKVYKIKREYIGDREQFAALKVIRIPSNAEDADFVFGADNNSTKEYYKSLVTNIVKEIELMSKVKGHTNIVSYEDHKVIENENDSGWTILIRMELLTPFSEYIKTKEMGIEDVTHLGIDICKALEVCKKYSIVHRDIKTENVFVSETGDFKLGDFGTARTFDKTLDMATMAGTYPYMAPEVIKQEPHGHQSDIYSLGIMMYKLINKDRFPFYPQYPEEITHDSVQEAFRKRLSGEKMSAPCGADTKLSDIILKACEYNIKDRFANATEMRNALEEGTTSKPAPFPWKIFLRIVACLGAIALIVTGIFFGLKHIPTAKNEDISIAGNFVAYGEEGYLEFTEYENIVEITGLLDSTSDIIIPQKINGKPVTSIKNNAFYYSYIESIELPATIEKIGSRAFYGVSGLKRIELPVNIISIGEFAFYDCVDLETVNIPSKTTGLDATAFLCCPSLKSITVDRANPDYSAIDGILFDKNQTVLYCYPAGKNNKEYTIPASVETVYEYSFNSVEVLEKIIIPPSVKILGESCFDGCKSLSHVDFSEGLITMEKRAFAETALKEIYLPDSLQTIGTAAFYNSSQLEKIRVGKNTYDISYSAFAYTEWLSNQKDYIIIGEGVLIGYNGTETSLKIPEGVKNIEALCFNLSDITVTDIEIPDSVKIIGSDFLTFCTPPVQLHIPASVETIEEGALNHYIEFNVTLDKNNSVYVTDEYGAIFTKDKTELIYYPITNTSQTYTIPEGVCKIAAYAFNNNKYLEEIIISDGVTEIGEKAFSGCSALKNIRFSDSLETIGNSAFEGAYKLDNLNLTSNIKEIGESSFSSCSNLVSVKIPSSVELIGDGAFLGCSKLKSVEVDEANITYKSIDGILYNKEVSSLYCYPGGKTDTSFTVPDTVEYLGSNSFEGNEYISFVTLPDTVKTINYSAFRSCDGLISVNLSKVSRIGAYAFSGCTLLENISFSNNLTAINDSAFSSCAKLGQINLPLALTYISDTAFSGCSSLKIGYIPEKVRYIGERAFSQTALDVIRIPAATKLGLGPFYKAANLQNISVDAESENYKTVDGVLYNSDKTVLVSYPTGKSEKTFSVPDTVTEIYSYAFANNPYLEQVVLPDSMKTISNNVFEYCSRLTDINLPVGLEEIGENAFRGCAALKEIYLPDGIKTLPYGLFSGCSMLNAINIPVSVNKIEESVFYNCASLESIDVAASNSSYVSVDGILFNYDKTQLIIYPSAKSGESYTVPNTVCYIADYAFSSVLMLKELNLPDSIESISEYSINSCNSLENINVDVNCHNYASVDGVLYNREISKLLLIPYGRTENIYTLPATVTFVSSNSVALFGNLKTLVVTNDNCVVKPDYIETVYSSSSE